MDSKYLTAAREAIVAAINERTTNSKKVAELKDRIDLERAAESNAHRLIQMDVTAGRLTESHAIVEKAKATAVTIETIKTIDNDIKTITRESNDSMVESAKKLLNTASAATIKASNVAGSAVGSVAHTPIQAALSFGKSFMNKISN